MFGSISLNAERRSNRDFVRELELCRNAQDAFFAADSYDRRGDHAERDLNKAIKYYEIAALRGHKYAADRLLHIYFIDQKIFSNGHIRSGGYESIRDPEKSLTWAFVYLKLSAAIHQYALENPDEVVDFESRGAKFPKMISVDNVKNDYFYAKNVQEMAPFIEIYPLDNALIESCHNKSQSLINSVKYEQMCLEGDMCGW